MGAHELRRGLLLMARKASPERLIASPRSARETSEKTLNLALIGVGKRRLLDCAIALYVIDIRGCCKRLEQKA
jgi:hypothetical protein